MEPSDAVLRAENLSKTYRSGASDLVVFSGLNLRVMPGERVAIVGESGSGKSTLLHLLGGLDLPSAGDIYYQSRNISHLSAAARAEFRNRQIGFVWQTHYLLPEFSAEENVMMPLLIRGLEKSQASAQARERLDEVGLAARAWHRSGELSGGEQQRVVLARALVTRPSLLLADEPTGNLDQKTGEMIFDLLGRLHQSHALTSVLATHNLAFARRCDRVLRFQGGSLSEVNTERGTA